MSITVIKTPLGTRDYNPEECLVREQLIEEIRVIFKKYGGQPLETPTFERKEYLLKKYGDDAKLVYELKSMDNEVDNEEKEGTLSKDGESSREGLCLRYDLTVPLARYLAQMNVVKLRRYQIAKVFRRDRPNVSKARLREFYQCDFDIIGEPATMIPEIQLMKIGQEILQKYKIDFKIKFNFRNNLIAILELAKIPKDLFLTTCSTLDKLDKKSYEEIVTELRIKGLSDQQIDSMRDLMKTNYQSEETKIQYDKFCNYTQTLGLNQYLQYEISLARGMDYYTGLIFEFILPDKPEIGTVIAGGRYDNLTRMFRESSETTAIGMSVGFERLFCYLMENKSNIGPNINPNKIIYLATIVKKSTLEEINALTQYKMKIYGRLLAYYPNNQIILDSDDKRPLNKQITAALENGADYLVFIGQSELANQTVTVKDLKNRNQKTIAWTDSIY